MSKKIYSSSLSRQSSETKPSTKLVSVSQEPLFYLEFNKPNKQNVYEINLFEKTFLSLQITVDTLIDVRNETSKHHILKSVKINKLTLLSIGSVPVHFRAQQRTKYSSLSLMANNITLFQTDLRITNHKAHKFPASTMLPSFKT